MIRAIQADIATLKLDAIVLELAHRHGIKSIAFPGISAGVYGYPREQAARITVTIMREHETKFDEIICRCFSEGDRLIYEKLLRV